MNIKELKAERKKIQKLIRNSNKLLLAEIKKKHPKFIRLIKRCWHVDHHEAELIDADYYRDIEYKIDQIVQERGY